nr:MAG TPA: hypothetical protein [Caudoviricetes sp.]
MCIIGGASWLRCVKLSCMETVQDVMISAWDCVFLNCVRVNCVG